MQINYEYRFFHGRQEFVQCPFNDFIKGTIMQIEKALINDRLRVSKVS